MFYILNNEDSIGVMNYETVFLKTKIFFKFFIFKKVIIMVTYQYINGAVVAQYVLKNTCG